MYSYHISTFSFGASKIGRQCLNVSISERTESRGGRYYRKNYRYRKFTENYRKIIVIEKFDLSPTPTTGWNTTTWSVRDLWTRSHWKNFPHSGFRRWSLKTPPTMRRWKGPKTARFEFLLKTNYFDHCWNYQITTRLLWQGKEISSEAVLRRLMRWTFHRWGRFSSSFR